MNDLGGDPPCWSHLVDDEDDARRGVIADLGAVAVRGSGAVWSLPHGTDLDANLVRLEPHARIHEHVNDEVDVLIFVQSGTGHLDVGGTRVDLSSDHLALIPKGVRRAVTAAAAGITYLSVHRHRGPLRIGEAPGRDR